MHKHIIIDDENTLSLTKEINTVENIIEAFQTIQKLSPGVPVYIFDDGVIKYIKCISGAKNSGTGQERIFIEVHDAVRSN